MVETLRELVYAGGSFGVGLAIGYYKSLNDLGKLYSTKADCLQVRQACKVHLDTQDDELKEDRELLTNIRIDLSEIKVSLKNLEAQIDS